MIDILSLFSLLIFSLASLSFLLVSYIALKNDATYKVNQLFSVAFVFAFFYFIFMGLYILPTFSFKDIYVQSFAFLGLVFINLSVFTFALVSEYIRFEVIQKTNLAVMLITLLVGLVSSYFIVIYFNNMAILFLGFSLLNLSLTVNSFRFIIVLFRLARREKEDLFFKKKINAYNIGFILFNILSALGWTLTLFLPLSVELQPLPPGIFTLLATLLMARSFLMKNN